MMCDISVIMSVYNGEEYLRECIESILVQTFKSFEFIIVDDGSTDNSKAIINSYNDPKIKLISQKNQGLASALNTGIKHAQGKYIARMDADDIAMPDRFRLQFHFLESNPDYIAIGSNAEIIDMAGEKLYTSEKPTKWEDIQKQLPSTPFFHSSVMFRKDTFLSVGGYNEDVRQYGEDMILWNQFALHGKLGNLHDALIKYRLVPTSVSNRNAKQCFQVNSIINSFLQKGYFETDEIENLRAITKSRSPQWKKSTYYQRIGKIFLENNFNKRKAFLNLSKSVYYNPVNLKSYFNIALLVLPYAAITAWKNYRYK